jgi:hypothetical protein
VKPARSQPSRVGEVDADAIALTSRWEKKQLSRRRRPPKALRPISFNCGVDIPLNLDEDLEVRVALGMYAEEAKYLRALIRKYRLSIASVQAMLNRIES